MSQEDFVHPQGNFSTSKDLQTAYYPHPLTMEMQNRLAVISADKKVKEATLISEWARESLRPLLDTVERAGHRLINRHQRISSYPVGRSVARFFTSFQ